MKHLTEEEMIEGAYGEGTRDAGMHLQECAACSRSFAELRSDLSDLDRMEPPERADAYGTHVWRAIESSLTAYAPRRRTWFNIGLMRGLSYAAACALLVGGAFYAGMHWEHWTQKPATAQIGQPKPKQPIVLVVLGDHLDRSERLLVELKHVDAENEAMMPPLRDEARSLLEANHVCRKKAEESGDTELKSALDRLDHLLTEMANQPGGLDAAAIERLKHEMNSDGLLFEVRVLRSRARDREPARGSQLNGGAEL